MLLLYLIFVLFTRNCRFPTTQSHAKSTEPRPLYEQNHDACQGSSRVSCSHRLGMLHQCFSRHTYDGASCQGHWVKQVRKWFQDRGSFLRSVLAPGVVFNPLTNSHTHGSVAHATPPAGLKCLNFRRRDRHIHFVGLLRDNITTSAQVINR